MSRGLASYNIPVNNSVNGFGLTFTGINYNVKLAANTEQNFTIPSGIAEGGGVNYKNTGYIAIFYVETPGVLGVGYNSTAVLPTGTVGLSSTTMVSDKDAYFVFAGDVISLIADAELNVGIRFYLK